MAGVYRSPGQGDRVRQWCLGALAAWPVPHHDKDVATLLGRTHVVSLGAGVGAGAEAGAVPVPAVCVYLPGTNVNAATSTVVLEALATRFRVYAADLPGQPGLSAADRPRDEVPGYARWLAELLDWVRARHRDARLVLVGHSRGAAVALSAQPGTVDGLALLSPAGLVGVRPSLGMLRATLPWLVRRDAPGSERLLRYMSGPGRSPSPTLVEWMALVARTCRTTGAPAPYPDAVVTPWRGRRVRVVVGDADVFFPVGRVRLASRTRLGTEPTVVNGAGHLLADEEPHRITSLVAALMAESE